MERALAIEEAELDAKCKKVAASLQAKGGQADLLGCLADDKA